MCDSGCIDAHIASQEVFRLRIIGATEHYLHKNVSHPGRGEQPEDQDKNENNPQKIRRQIGIKELNNRNIWCLNNQQDYTGPVLLMVHIRHMSNARSTDI